MDYSGILTMDCTTSDGDGSQTDCNKEACCCFEIVTSTHSVGITMDSPVWPIPQGSTGMFHFDI